jgi:methylmalonyl-CoA mutase
VIDVAAGSYYIENLTHSLVVHAWDLFLKIEERGGYIECIKSGFVQDEIEASSRKEEMDIAMRKTVMIGINQYPDLKESILDRISTQPAKAKGNPDTPPKYRTLDLSRCAQPFEMLRLALENFVGSGGKKPSVYLLTFGNPAKRKARATFATNFFGCAGYEILEEATLQTIDEGVKAILDAEAEIIVICSSDEEYADIAPSVVMGIKKKNPSIKVIVAGYPNDSVETLKNAGVDDFIHIRSNLIETLTRYHKLLGIIK